MAMRWSCEPCRQKKRKCDRGVPACGLCVQRGRRCFYPPYLLGQAKAARHPDNMIASTSAQAWDAVTYSLFSAWAVQSPDIPMSYPIPSRWYIPRLLKEFIEGLGVCRLQVGVNSTAHQFQTIWPRDAMSDPALFHATLYAGGSYLDIGRGEPQSEITLYHQAQAIKLVNERLSDPRTAVEDRTVLAITPLALFANLTGNRAVADTHREGLRVLVEMRGGHDKLGFEGLASALIRMNSIVYNIAFDLEPATISAPLGPPPLGLERRILKTPSTLSSRIHCLPAILEILHHVYSFKLVFQSQESVDATGRHGAHSSLHASSTPGLHLEDPIYYCCHLAVRLFHCIVNNTLTCNPSSSSTILDTIASELKVALALTDPYLWTGTIPAVLCWICLTGAAASNDPQTRIWFYFRQAPAARVLNFGSGHIFQDELWSHFRWLRMLRLGSMRYLSEETGSP
ncbi:hypothetical protein BJX63DRAFT_150491 [Aspergillus granulosus]|uniref:Zn(2)-C6 fungal-type domain-containing protein n=1 Tax=Aspergillus granulosus TaxID=176169 RepID=A0ABR4GRZ4_9EURO